MFFVLGFCFSIINLILLNSNTSTLTINYIVRVHLDMKVFSFRTLRRGHGENLVIPLNPLLLLFSIRVNTPSLSSRYCEHPPLLQEHSEYFPLLIQGKTLTPQPYGRTVYTFLSSMPI